MNARTAAVLALTAVTVTLGAQSASAAPAPVAGKTTAVTVDGVSLTSGSLAGVSLTGRKWL